jgi:hypothetical protein
LEIIKNAAYAIGTVNSYRFGGKMVSYVSFQFSVKGEPYSQAYGDGGHHWNVPSTGIHIGDKYMVQYDSLNPPTARMLFSYPVSDSADYKKYVALFKKTPPSYPSP